MFRVRMEAEARRTSGGTTITDERESRIVVSGPVVAASRQMIPNLAIPPMMVVFCLHGAENRPFLSRIRTMTHLLGQVGSRVPALLLALLSAGCGSDSAGEPRLADASVGDRLDDAIVWDREISLEESEKTINVIVRAELDPHGGFLVADEQEGFARRYDRGGRLLVQFGGKGAGPAEFPNLMRVIRLPDGTLVGFDVFNKIAVFDSAGAQLLRTARSPVGPLHSALLLNDSIVLLGGPLRSGSPDSEGRLHLWNLRSDSVLTSFFVPPLPSEAHALADQAAGWAAADRRGDTLAVVSSLSDTLYLMSTTGEQYGQIPIPARGYRRLDPRTPRPDARGGVIAARRWISTFSLISDVFWLDDAFIVQYQDRTGPQPRWRFVAFDRDGHRRFEVIDSPKLLTANRASGVLYFVSPESLTPNEWRAGRLAGG